MRTTYRILMISCAIFCFLLPSSLLAKSITQTTTNKKFSVTMTTPEDGLSVGKNNISLKIFDVDDYEVVGATVNVKPWMPGMGHGVFLEPTVQEKDNGIYEIGNVGFSMPGHWQLVVSVKTDSIFDQATFEFQNITGEMGAGCACGPDCKCEHCRTGKGPCACQVKIGTDCKMADGKCQGNCSCGCKEGKPCNMVGGKCTGECGCGCQAGNAAFNCPCGTGGNCPTGCGCGCKAGTAARCNMTGGKCQGNCTCGCKEGKPCNMVGGKCVGGCGCGCQAGPTEAKCNMKDGKCLGNCSCGCKEGKPCQMKDGKCIGGCGCGCKAGTTAFNCPCGTGGNCPKSCRCGCQPTNVPNCKCGPGCTTLINCSCGNNCACAMDGKDGCGCIAGCRSGCPNGVCPLPKKAGTS